jgi:antitoxin ParD1/3/4
MTITVTLTPDQQKWLDDEVAAGRFDSPEQIVRFAIAELMLPIDTDDLAWAKPYVDEAIAQIERGEGIPAEKVFAETDAWLKKHGG